MLRISLFLALLTNQAVALCFAHSHGDSNDIPSRCHFHWSGHSHQPHSHQGHSHDFHAHDEDTHHCECNAHHRSVDQLTSDDTSSQVIESQSNEHDSDAIYLSGDDDMTSEMNRIDQAVIGSSLSVWFVGDIPQASSQTGQGQFDGSPCAPQCAIYLQTCCLLI